MIEFIAENEFVLLNQEQYKNWIQQIIASEGKTCGDISYVFCDDVYLNKINKEYLNHEDYTDIISFDYTQGSIISGDIFISTERVGENAEKYEVSFEKELLRVLTHGILHYCGYKDKTDEEKATMRNKEQEKMRMFHVEHS